MNGNKIFLDTNIILYLFSGDKNLATLLHNKTVYISFITELELLGYKNLNPEDLIKIEFFLNTITIIDINSEIKKLTTEIRRKYTVKLPDAIIAATSYYLSIPFLTADKKITKIVELNILYYEQ